ncbi:MAG: eukaryotic-like serine/threonine-protein kinase [Blastocatellia bacterium]|jgi:serine/threonine-protein kinase|nr:eukaryotic-like serine/threonine-protein kinase [Blastocatellia bacterium]
MLSERYRIVGLLGKGGMGEVYRADDLKLGQPVALKFLPDHLLKDAAAVARFHREVRVARRVSHKNVCRVYDIGEVDGHHFLSMEYIKGEELSSFMRRIGRLPNDKAIQIARQMCAGLAAAHDVGVLHRDLKPSNVMIDEDGNARITDFGLAGLSEDFNQEEMGAGTPAYMSPEQLERQAVTVRSDIYSLGLVLYELFTGSRAFEAATLGELLRLRRSDTTPTTPSDIVKDIDPVIERVIDRCLQKNPAQRPASALQVAAALPGGDPIAAALAAGETPSPEMVAATPRQGALRPVIALAMFVSLLFGLALVAWFAPQVELYGFLPLEKSPEVLRERAREVIHKLGSDGPATDEMQSFEHHTAPLQYMARTDQRPNRWEDLRDGQPTPLEFWYRRSPDYFSGFDYFRNSWTNPPPTISGMAGVRLDPRGRLLSFYAVPPQVDLVTSRDKEVSGSGFQVPGQAAGQSPASNVQSPDNDFKKSAMANPPSAIIPDWSIAFNEAGMNIADFKPAASQWAPLYMNDSRLAWEGVYPDQQNIPIRVEAASYRGHPVSFEIVNPWDKPERQNPAKFPAAIKALITLLVSVFVLVLIGSVLLAIKNFRLGRGDRKGALRLAFFIFSLTMISRLFTAHHAPVIDEFFTLLNGLQDAVFAGGFFWVLYVALEPFVRKRWPNRIVSWARLLAGDFRDPMVGRDVLMGAVFGIGITLWQLFFHSARRWMGDATLTPVPEPNIWNLGMGRFVGAVAEQLTTPLLNSFEFLFFILLLALLFRRDWLAFIGGWVMFTAGLAFLGGNTAFSWIGAAVAAGITTFVLYRYGILVMLSALLYLHLYLEFPATTQITAWYATGFLLNLILLIALAFYAFHASLAGQRVFGGKLLQE